MVTDIFSVLTVSGCLFVLTDLDLYQYKDGKCREGGD